MERGSALNEVDNILKSFAAKKFKVAETDYGWRHMGRFNGKVYLFDLADLEEMKADVDDGRVAHIAYLQEAVPV